MGKIDAKLADKLRNFKKDISSRYGVVKLVLFGSMATGTARGHSDVDLLVVVKEYDKELVDSLMSEWHEKHKIHYPVDFIQLSEARFEKMSKGINIVSQALKEGVII